MCYVPYLLRPLFKNNCQTLECKANVTNALQSLDAEREEQKVRAEYLAKSAYDMEVRVCEGDSACVAKYQSIRYQAEDYLHDVYVQYVNGEISDEKFTGGMQVAFTLAAQGAGESFTGLRNLTWEQVQQGLVASYTNIKNTVTAEVPAFEIEKSFGAFVANAQTDKAIGGLAFDAALGTVVGYAGGKVIGWTAEKGWQTLAPAVAQQAEQFLKSQGLVLNVVPEINIFDAPIFRGGNNLTPRRNIDYKINSDGYVNGRGISLNLDKLDINIQKYGGAFEVDATTVPDGLKVVKTTGTHYEIQPTRAMKENEFLDLMKQIKLKNTNKI